MKESTFELDKAYINAKCLDYFDYKLLPLLESINNKRNDLLCDIKKLQDIDKKRLGFYLLALEVLCDISSSQEREILIKESIIDQKFNQIIFGESSSDDLGIDVVYIKEYNDKADVRLFNFKYREDQNENSGQKENEALASYKFLSTLKDSSLYKNAEGKTKKKIEEIKNLLDKKIVDMKFYMVTNENNNLPKSKSLDTFRSTFNINIESITQNQIIKIILKKLSCNCVFIADANAMFEYKQTKGIKSIVTSISALELLRITCSDSNSRIEEVIASENSNIDIIANYSMEFNLLNDNVRGYIRNNTNQKVIETLENESERFFIFNNGITIVSDQLDINPINLKNKNIIKLTNFQVVNGGQTLRNIYEYKCRIKDCKSESDKYKLIGNLKNSFVLLRIFSLSELEIKKDIAKYTNSQTAITEGQLKAFNREQLIIERELSEHSIKYVMKEGDFGEDENINTSITMVELAQILDSIENKKPYRAAGRKKDLIESYYDEIFINSHENYKKYHIYIKIYHEVRITLESWIRDKNENIAEILSDYNYFDARIDSQSRFIINLTLYILYILGVLDNLDLNKTETETENEIKVATEFISESIKSINQENVLTLSKVNNILTKSNIVDDINKNVGICQQEFTN